MQSKSIQQFQYVLRVSQYQEAEAIVDLFCFEEEFSLKSGWQLENESLER